jgi:hypothetical protein
MSRSRRVEPQTAVIAVIWAIDSSRPASVSRERPLYGLEILTAEHLIVRWPSCRVHRKNTKWARFRIIEASGFDQTSSAIKGSEETVLVGRDFCGERVAGKR